MKKITLLLLIFSIFIFGCSKDISNYTDNNLENNQIAGIPLTTIKNNEEPIINSSLNEISHNADLPIKLMFQYPEHYLIEKQLDWFGVNWSIKPYFNKYENETTMIDIIMYLPIENEEFTINKIREISKKYLEKYTYNYYVSNFDATDLYLEMPPIKIISKFTENETSHSIYSNFEIGVKNYKDTGDLAYIKISFLNEHFNQDIDLVEIREMVDYIEIVSKNSNVKTNFKKVYLSSNGGFMKVEEKEEKNLSPEEKLNLNIIFKNP